MSAVRMPSLPRRDAGAAGTPVTAELGSVRRASASEWVSFANGHRIGDSASVPAGYGVEF